jgi:ATP-dependent Clp protease ATP-binding subunit ClpB
VNFRNTVIIMTSNIGSQWILEHSGEERALLETQVTSALRQHFRPEFLNRVDDIIIFRALGAAELERIIDLQLGHLDRLLADRNLTIELLPEARALIAQEGYDPAFGARPLKRAVQRMIQNPLSLLLLEGKFSDGDHIVVGTGPSGALVFESATPAASVPPA